MPDSDHLYGLPLDEFTPARDALAARLRKEGDREAAAEVKKLRKPSLAAWAVNQVARRDHDDVKRLLDLREALEQAADASSLRGASDERRRLIAALVARAEVVLDQAGRSSSATTIQAITQTFHAAGDEADRDALVHGRLTRELTPSGFGGFALGDFEEPASQSDPKLEQKRQRAQELAAEADQAEEEATRLEAQEAAAERALQRARAESDAARRAAEQARSHADRAQAEVAAAGGLTRRFLR